MLCLKNSGFGGHLEKRGPRRAPFLLYIYSKNATVIPVSDVVLTSKSYYHGPYTTYVIHNLKFSIRMDYLVN